MNPAPGQTRAIAAEDVDVLLTTLKVGRALTPKERADAEAIVSTHKHVVELLQQGEVSIRELKKLLGIKSKKREGKHSAFTGSGFLWGVFIGITASFGLLAWLIKGPKVAGAVVAGIALLGALSRYTASRMGAKSEKEL